MKPYSARNKESRQAKYPYSHSNKHPGSYNSETRRGTCTTTQPPKCRCFESSSWKRSREGCKSKSRITKTSNRSYNQERSSYSRCRWGFCRFNCSAENYRPKGCNQLGSCTSTKRYPRCPETSSTGGRWRSLQKSPRRLGSSRSESRQNIRPSTPL